MIRTLSATAAATLWLTAAQADPFTDEVVTRYQDMGFSFIEVQNGPTQVKVEAVRGGDKIEVIYDRATGRILKQEQERADTARTGLQIDDRGHDFLDDDEDDDDRSGHGGADDDDQDDDNSGHGGGDDDDDGDDNSGPGSHD